MDLLAFAKNIADRVEAQSAQAKVPVAVCVIDIHGNIILKHRMSGAPTFSIELSERKAYTSALVGTPNGRAFSACAAWAAAVSPDGVVGRAVLFDGRRSTSQERGPNGRGRRCERWNRRSGRRHS